MRGRDVLGVTGTPGTGKKSISPTLSSILRRDLVDLNSFATEVVERPRARPEEEVTVDPKSLRRELLKRMPERCVVSGHLLPDVLRRGEVGFVAVLRCEPLVLKGRLEGRGYSHTKVLENVEGELIGVVLDAALRAFGHETLHEYDTTKATPERVAKAIARDYKAGSRSDGPWTDWTLAYDSSSKLRLLLSDSEKNVAAST
ncbi:MAG: AAA family ATPase [Thaumarchaeota archaeon]|nr:AAA family ATPase [Nitrososphaerota archaeon]